MNNLVSFSNDFLFFHHVKMFLSLSGGENRRHKEWANHHQDVQQGLQGPHFHLGSQVVDHDQAVQQGLQGPHPHHWAPGHDVQQGLKGPHPAPEPIHVFYTLFWLLEEVLKTVKSLRYVHNCSCTCTGTTFQLSTWPAILPSGTERPKSSR